MFKAASMIAGAAAIATVSLLFVPSLSQVEAGTPTALAKADRLDIPTSTVQARCATQAWPNIEAVCLRHADSKSPVRPVRVVALHK